jgi:hypothetical protein
MLWCFYGECIVFVLLAVQYVALCLVRGVWLVPCKLWCQVGNV